MYKSHALTLRRNDRIFVYCTSKPLYSPARWGAVVKPPRVACPPLMLPTFRPFGPQGNTLLVPLVRPQGWTRRTRLLTASRAPRAEPLGRTRLSDDGPVQVRSLAVE